MMKKLYSIIAMVILALSCLPGCTSYNVSKFTPRSMDVASLTTKGRASSNKAIVSSVVIEDNIYDKILCRNIESIYLPGKQPYADYIKNSIKTTLSSANRLAAEGEKGSNIDLVIKRIRLDTVRGEWDIKADVRINGGAYHTVKSTTKFGSAYKLDSACYNASKAFEVATGDFVKNIIFSPNVAGVLRPKRL